MRFASDNWSGVTPEVMEAVNRANAERFAPAYGNDPLTAAAKRRFSEIFEREVEVFFVASGTAANALSMSAVARPAGFVFCTEEAHLHNDEFNATEAATGMKLVPVASRQGKMQPDGLRAALRRFPAGRSGPLTALTLTNATELGTVYTPDEVTALGAIAGEHGMRLHIDGARFANAVAATGASPADLTWRAGADLMSFGGTKNGCLAAEAVVVFTPGALPDLMALRQRAGHGLSKQRYIAAQYDAYLADGAWLRRAGHANEMAARLAAGLRAAGATLDIDGTANELFPVLDEARVAALQGAGADFHVWEELPDGRKRIRLVTSWSTTAEDVNAFLAAL
jgi:threonine aldolase